MYRAALILAADHFNDSSVTPLEYAEADGHEWVGLLKEAARFDRVEALFGPKLTSQGALDMAEQLSQGVAAHGGGLLSVLLFGHAFENNGKHIFLCPNAQLRELRRDEYARAITHTSLLLRTQQPSVHRSLYWDTCRKNLNRGLRDGTVQGQATQVLFRDLGAQPVDAADDLGEWSLFLTCDEGQQSQEIDTFGRGLVSHLKANLIRELVQQGREVRLDEDFRAELQQRLDESTRQLQLPVAQRTCFRTNGRAPVLVPARVTAASPPRERQPSASVPPQLPPRTKSAMDRAVRIARERDVRRQTFEGRRATFHSLKNDRHVKPAELAEAWAAWCHEEGLKQFPPMPGDLEWDVDAARLVGMFRPDFVTCEQPFVNSLGLRFVPVPGTDVLFSVWKTRVRDFKAFVAETKYDATAGVWSGRYGHKPVEGRWEWKQQGDSWKSPGFEQGPDHPVPAVSWEDGKAMARWLTAKERAAGLIPEGYEYRFPTDLEWSRAVGLAIEPGATPEERDEKVGDLYPWGTEWPPPKGSGNYADVTFKKKFPDYNCIEGYEDGWAGTSPVGTFRANGHGLYDMGGNLWEWTEDWWNAKREQRVLRGGSWSNNDPRNLLSSYRNNDTPSNRNTNIGFRLVLGRAGAVCKVVPWTDQRIGEICRGERHPAVSVPRGRPNRGPHPPRTRGKDAARAVAGRKESWT